MESIHGHSLNLLTDLYELTMACGYWQSGMAEREAVFTQTFRSQPFQGGYTVACGINDIAGILEDWHFERDELDYLAGLAGNDGAPLFPDAFLEELGSMDLRCDIDAPPEGAVVFPHEPLARVRGPLLQCQLLESLMLNVINFQTLIATKSARVCQAAAGDPVLEFGLRRAQGVDGALSVARASFVGGCDATSNVLAGKRLGIPVKGTHAHSWIMAFADEVAAFEAWGDVMPHNSVFLVDTYDTLEGVRRAAKVGRDLEARGHAMAGVRLDSGDLAYLSQQARRILDDAGLPEAKIFASSELDEHIIQSLKQQGAKIDVWGVGTRLATAWDEPALGGVYKLGALRNGDGAFEYKIKLSEQRVKVNTPGFLQVRRFRRDGEPIGDMIYDVESGEPAERTLVDIKDPTRRKRIPDDAEAEELLEPIFRAGRRVAELPSLEESQARAKRELDAFHPGIRRFINPHEYPVGLERGLHQLRTRLIEEAHEGTA